MLKQIKHKKLFIKANKYFNELFKGHFDLSVTFSICTIMFLMCIGNSDGLFVYWYKQFILTDMPVVAIVPCGNAQPLLTVGNKQQLGTKAGGRFGSDAYLGIIF